MVSISLGLEACILQEGKPKTYAPLLYHNTTKVRNNLKEPFAHCAWDKSLFNIMFVDKMKKYCQIKAIVNFTYDPNEKLSS